MTWIAYELSPRARVSAGTGGSLANQREIHRVIPGVTVRGALARTWLEDPTYGFPDPDLDLFRDRFLSRASVYQAVPSVGGRPVKLRWFSQVRCKYPTTDTCTVDWRDEALSDVREPCGCGGGTERGAGWSSDPSMESAATRSQLTAQGFPEKDRLFTRLALGPAARGPEGAALTLRGCLRIDDPHADALDWLLADKDVWIGGQRSTMGSCAWRAWTTQAPAAPVATQGSRTVMVVASPAILVDEYGAPSLDLAAALGAVGAPGKGTVKRPRIRPVEVGGWNGVAGVPRPTDLAVAAGSVAVLEDWSTAVLAVVAEGIGLRRDEGYGEVWFLDGHGQPQPTVPAARPTPAPSVPASTPGSEPPFSTVADTEARHDDAPSAAGPGPGAASVPDPCEDLAASARDSKARRAAIRGTLTAARYMRRGQEQGLPDSFLATKVGSFLDMPWARDLGGESRALVRRILEARTEDAQDRVAHISHLEALEARS